MLKTIDPEALHGHRVRVYKNLHRDCFSVTLVKTRKVIWHTDAIVLMNATFPVGLKSRARAIKEGRRNVHAFVEGTFNEALNKFLPFIRVESGRAITYNPFVSSAFRYIDTNDPVFKSPLVIAARGKIHEITPDHPELFFKKV